MQEESVAASMAAGVGYSPRPPSKVGISVTKEASEPLKDVWQRNLPVNIVVEV